MEQSLVYSYERIDDLQLDGLKIIQNPKWFCFGTDAVLLSDFASKSIKKDAEILDMCSGNGIISLLLSSKSDAKKIHALEVQPNVAEMAVRTVKLNGLENKIIPRCGDLKHSEEYYGRSFFNNIICNPPYKESGGGLTNKDDPVTLARHEILCSLEDIIRVSSIILAPGGKLSMIHRPERLADIFCLMRKYKIEPKRLRFVHPSAGKTATMILVEGAYCGRPKLFLESPLYVYKEPGVYSDEINLIYNRKKADI
ncbi:MAG: tRNA1(Val) (adenine(37)-N6)-methyltransferase [Monoglobaceae bacterium]